MLIIDSRMRKIEKNKLKELGYTLFEIKPNVNLYNEISCHPDIHCTKIKENIISNIPIFNSIVGSSNLSKKYPFDIPYNVCIMRKFRYSQF